MHTHPFHHRLAAPAAPVANGSRTEPVHEPAPPGTVAAESASVGAASGVALIAAAAGMLTGLWVAISPWFVTLQTTPGANATVNNLIVGLAVAGLCLRTITGTRNADGLTAAILVAGVWLIISPFILDAKIPITPAAYWTNVWSGAIVIVTALAALGVRWSRAAT